MRRAIGRWALMAVAVPLAAAGARKVSQRMETRKGPSRVSGLLRQGADLLQGSKPRRRRWW
jgi:NADH:ubiquinone oxidoreductase subunit H